MAASNKEANDSDVESRAYGSEKRKQELSREQKIEVIQGRLRLMIARPLHGSFTKSQAGSDDSKSQGHSASIQLARERPTLDPYKKAIEYYEQHQILDAFQQLTASLVLQRPDDPIQHLISECAKMQAKSESLATKSPMIEPAFHASTTEK